MLVFCVQQFVNCMPVAKCVRTGVDVYVHVYCVLCIFRRHIVAPSVTESWIGLKHGPRGWLWEDGDPDLVRTNNNNDENRISV